MGKEEETKGTCGHEMQWEWWHDGVGNQRGKLSFGLLKLEKGRQVWPEGKVL